MCIINKERLEENHLKNQLVYTKRLCLKSKDFYDNPTILFGGFPEKNNFKVWVSVHYLLYVGGNYQIKKLIILMLLGV